MLTEWLLLGVAVLLVAGNAVFVAAEFSFITVDRAAVERRAAEGDSRADSLAQALRTLSTQLSGAQLGITITSLVVGFIAEPSLATLLRGPLRLTGMPDAAVTATSVGVALATATVFQMVLGELVPKNWAIAQPMRLGRWVAGAQRTFTTSTGWLIGALNGTANAILRLFQIEPTEELASARSPQELSSLVDRSAREGKLDAPTAGLLARSLEMSDRTAADVMTPRPRVTFVDGDAPVTVVRETSARTGHARFPVVGDNFDDIVGFVHFKHALAVPAEERAQRQVREVMVPVAHVPDSMGLSRLLDILREPSLQVVVVIDEYGGTAGIVTLEDLVEEIVGEIEDEQDERRPRHRQGPDGTWMVSGLLRPDEVSHAVDVRLPEAEQSETLGGLLVERLGRLPEVGDEVVVEAQDTGNADTDGVAPPVELALKVLRLDGRRVDRVEVARKSGASEEGERDE